jgi:hypothetical protein
MGSSEEKKWATALIKATYINDAIKNKEREMQEGNISSPKNNHISFFGETKNEYGGRILDEKKTQLHNSKQAVIDEIKKITSLISVCQEKCVIQKEQLERLEDELKIAKKGKEALFQLKIKSETQVALLGSYKKVIFNISGKPLDALNNITLSESSMAIDLSGSLREVIGNLTEQIQNILTEINHINNQVKEREKL